MTPIRTEDPIGAIGAYWASRHTASDEELEILQALGDSAAMAIANVQLIQELKDASRREQELPALSEGTASTGPVAAHLRVLIVEDDQDSAESLRLLLEVCGYEVALAATGPDGVEAAKAGRPDVVLCDIGLPGMDGFEVASTLRGSPETAATRLIAVTGHGRDEDRQRALEAGFDAHLVKPVDPEKLLGHLRASAGV